MTLRGIVLLFGIIYLLWGCSGQPVNPADIKKPDWLTTESARYSSSTYITGIGSYKYLGKAKTLARKDIANKFNIVIDKEMFKPLSANRTYTTSTENLLKNIQIVDVWEHPVSSVYHVFAILSRKQSIVTLRQEISRLDYKTRAIINNTAIAQGKLGKIYFAHQALDKQIERNAYQQALNKFNPSGLPVQKIWEISKLNTDFKKLLRRIRIKPHVINDDSKKIEQTLVQGLELAGFTIDLSQSADFTLQATLELDSYKEKDDDHYISKGKLKIKLTDRGRNIRGTHHWPIRVSVTNSDNTNTKIGEQALQTFKLYLQSTLTRFGKQTL